MSTAKTILRVVEPLIFEHRAVGIAILTAVTLFMGWQASQTEIDAGFGKQLPLKHEYMGVFEKYQESFGGANLISIALINKKGDIYNAEFIEALQKVTEEVFFLDGVERGRVKSLVTPGVRYLEIVEGGFESGDVFPRDYKPTPEVFAQIKENVAKAGIIGRLVASNQRGAMITAELLELHPVTGEKLDYVEVAKKIEAIRTQYETDDIRIHIIGFAKIVGDVTDAAGEVIKFFIIAIILTAILLRAYSASWRLSALPLFASLIAVVWEFGLLHLFGFGLDPFAILVPFLVFANGVEHGIQMVNAWADEFTENDGDSYGAAVNSFRRVAIPGTAALITDIMGFATIALIEIQIIQEMAINAALGMAAIAITNKWLMPIMLTWVKISNVERYQMRLAKRENIGNKVWVQVARVTEPKIAGTAITLAVLLFGWALWKGQEMKIGDSQIGVPELKPDSRYNQDSRAIVENFYIGVDILKVIAETEPQSCIEYDTMKVIDRYAWHVRNTEGVQSVISLAQLAKRIRGEWNEGLLKWRVLPRNQYAMVQSINPVPSSLGMQTADCSAMPVLIFTKDHKAETINGIVNMTKAFNQANKDEFYAANPQSPRADCEAKADLFHRTVIAGNELSRLELQSDETLGVSERKATLRANIEKMEEEYEATAELNCPVNFALATGNVGVMAATNEVIEDRQNPVLLWVYAAVTLMCWLSFRSIAGVICVVLPLSLVSFLAYAVMAILDIGLKVATLPVTALAVGIGIDFGIYTYSVLSDKLNEGLKLKQAYFETLRETGKAVAFTGVALSLGVITWLWSGLQFQVDMGILMTFMFLANMVAAIILLPALARFLDPRARNEGPDEPIQINRVQIEDAAEAAAAEQQDRS